MRTRTQKQMQAVEAGGGGVAEEVNGIRLGYARVGNAVVVVVVVGMLCGERSQQRMRCEEY